MSDPLLGVPLKSSASEDKEDGDVDSKNPLRSILKQPPVLPPPASSVSIPETMGRDGKSAARVDAPPKRPKRDVGSPQPGTATRLGCDAPPKQPKRNDGIRQSRPNAEKATTGTVSRTRGKEDALHSTQQHRQASPMKKASENHKLKKQAAVMQEQVTFLQDMILKLQDHIHLNNDGQSKSVRSSSTTAASTYVTASSTTDEHEGRGQVRNNRPRHQEQSSRHCRSKSSGGDDSSTVISSVSRASHISIASTSKSIKSLPREIEMRQEEGEEEDRRRGRQRR